MKEEGFMNAVGFAVISALLYEILYNQTGDRFYRAARKLFIFAAAIAAVVEFAA